MSSPTTLAPRRLAVPGLRALCGWAGLAGALGVAVTLATAAAAGPSFLVRTPEAALPAWVAGPLAGLGDTVHHDRFLLLIVLLAVSAALAAVGASALPVRVVVGGIVLVQLVFVLAPPLLSGDVFSYMIYGRMGALHGLDPYVVRPTAVAGDPVFPFVGWAHTRSVYGPLFTVLTYPLAALGPGGMLWSLKLLAGVASLAIVACVWRIARLRGTDPRVPAVLVGLNPILLAYGVGGAHNDLLMLAVMMGAVLLAVRGADGWAGGTLVASAALKAGALVLLPFMVLGARRRRASVGGVLVGLAAAGLLAVLAFGSHAAGFVDVLSRQQGMLSRFSAPDGLADLAAGGVLTSDLRFLVHLVYALTLLGLLAWTWRGADWITAGAWALLATAAASTWLMPWYTMWALPAAAVARDRRVLGAVFLFQALFLLRQFDWPVLS